MEDEIWGVAAGTDDAAYVAGLITMPGTGGRPPDEEILLARFR